MYMHAYYGAFDINNLRWDEEAETVVVLANNAQTRSTASR